MAVLRFFVGMRFVANGAAIGHGIDQNTVVIYILKLRKSKNVKFFDFFFIKICHLLLALFRLFGRARGSATP